MISRTTRPLLFHHLLALLLILSMIEARLPTCRGGEVEMDRVRREYPAACAKLRQFYEQMSGMCVVTKTTKGRQPYSTEVKFAVQGPSRKLSLTEDPIPGGPQVAREVVFCTGDQASFSLSREPGTRQGGWRLLSAGGDQYEAANYEWAIGQHLQLPYGGGQKFILSDLIEGNGRRLTAVDPVDLDGRPCLQLRFEPVAPIKGNSSLVVVDPEMAWAVRRMDVFSSPGKISYSARAEYGSIRDNMPVPRLMTAHDAKGTDRACDFKTISFEPIPAAEFSLPFYGLPAVNGRGGRASLWRGGLWLGVIGIAGLASAYALRRVAKRRDLQEATS